MDTVTSADATAVAYSAAGSGPALILVDGALCYGGAGPMSPLAERLTGHFPVYTYDRRGRGGSGDTAPYAVEREIDDLSAVIAHAGGRTSVLGLSSGGALVVR